jgi:hypothetical protein
MLRRMIVSCERDSYRQKPGYRLTTDLRDWLELADATDLNPVGLKTRTGSTPVFRTNI